MRPFRFRAASVLELRQKQEDAARVVLVRAQNAAALAESRFETARAQAADAQARLVALQAQATPAWMISWHRSWIVRQAQAVDACRTDVVAAIAAVARAVDTVREAQRKRRVLERLRDRQAARHARAVARHELNEMNELAGLRYLARAAERKEQP
ncbi:MAG: flagellar FliJ family protein [Vicinamibacterales bacterium]